MGQTNEQQRHFNKRPISELHGGDGEVDSIKTRGGIFKQSMGARNQGGIGYRTGPPGYIG
jgi:hypothetical protein